MPDTHAIVLAFAATPVAVRRARRAGIRVPDSLRIEIASDEFILSGSPEVIATAGWTLGKPEKTAVLTTTFVTTPNSRGAAQQE